MGLECDGNKTWLSPEAGMGMGMNHWERKGVGLKKHVPHTTTHVRVYRSLYIASCV